MGKALLLLSFFICAYSQAQILPSDSLILSKIYGKVDSGKNSYSRAFRGYEGDFTYKKCISYSVVFKQNVELDSGRVLLVIIEAPNSTQTGHQFGYRDFYFFDQTLSCIDSVLSDSEIPIGDNTAFEIIDIGLHKKALVSNFQSTGNRHFEHTKYLQSLEIGSVTDLFWVDIEYDNSAWEAPEDEHEQCIAQTNENSYEIIKSTKEWFDIKVHCIEYAYSKGCLKRYVKSTSDKNFVYENGEYIEKKKE